ncbi:hypothetical protein PVK06_041714 [Gossypium arboreum]|uniref:DUF4283 domain-containing protein n=1 Tax=Gossypium arboreum TaxID=29729 RepID=A0ABR0N9U9_GOSAR|nr:hypothetical protein PVK06_041714 [Gossypium arboreum]
MANLWHPIGRICITDLGNKRYLFQFFNEVDVQRMMAGTLWFFNSHLLLLQRIQKGENLSVLLLIFSEFWIQVHELPAGLMSEPMARQFGDFLGKFHDYDTSIPSSSNRNYMRIRVRLDVTAPLKRKKKIQVGGALIVYARFKYEKLSLFRFICGKLGHGESHCPFHLRINPSKIIFGWDLSIRVVPRRRNTVVSRWLCEADGSQCQVKNMESSNHSNSIIWEMDSGHNIGRDFGDKMSNPNLILLGSNQKFPIKENNNGSSLGKDILFVAGLENGLMEMIVEEENDLLTAVEGKKRQRLVTSLNVTLGFNVESGTLNLTASSGAEMENKKGDLRSNKEIK